MILHSHSNMTYLKSVNQSLGTSSVVRFEQVGLGQAVYSTWSAVFKEGCSLRAGKSVDWENGNARMYENTYVLYFKTYDGATLTEALRLGQSTNTSSRVLATNGFMKAISSVSASTPATKNNQVFLVTTGATDKTITLPITGISNGQIYTVKKIDAGAGNVIVIGESGNIDGAANKTWNVQNEFHSFIKYGGEYFIV